ncbi:MAG TPA: glycerol-3-phosphate 1-O-acyltransferase PlsY [Paracoccaceae bacterium]|nr:glycerol-3-phosphate 1-O-acyltransferase PlsY [Paracoccaceae bacterium]
MLPEIVSSPLALALTALLAYLAGSIPFGLVITRAMGLGDIRQIGSGNIGSTNVLRTGSKTAAAATLVLDGAKGGVAVLVARAVLAEDAAQLAGAAAFFGHLYPVWLGFKGGKGVATYLGTLLALFWPAGVAACALWLAAAAVGRISSLAALVAAAGSIPALGLLGAPQAMALGAVLTALIFWRHRSNIARIRAGTEPRIGRKRD